MHHRLFAKLLMFLTLFLGGMIGYVAGFQMGQQNAITLLQQGRQTEQTSAKTDRETMKKSSAVSDPVDACYQETLGAARYKELSNDGQKLTIDEVSKLLPCDNLQTSSKTTQTTPAAY